MSQAQGSLRSSQGFLGARTTGCFICRLNAGVKRQGCEATHKVQIAATAEAVAMYRI